MVNALLSIVHDLLYCLSVLEFTEAERNYIIGVIMRAVNLMIELNNS